VEESAAGEKKPRLYDSGKEKVMGSRDKRGREKRKPKRKEIKPSSVPARPTPEYKPPVVPPQPQQTNEETS
jgi:hypothetical protein